MEWSAVAMIVFSCVAINHLGLIKAIQNSVRHDIPIVNCPKCLTFWSIVSYSLYVRSDIITAVATALLMSYAAIWLELLMGIIDYLYDRIYEQIYPAADTPADDKAGADSAMPEMWVEYGPSEGPGQAEPSEEHKAQKGQENSKQ